MRRSQQFVEEDTISLGWFAVGGSLALIAELDDRHLIGGTFFVVGIIGAFLASAG